MSVESGCCYVSWCSPCCHKYLPCCKPPTEQKNETLELVVESRQKVARKVSETTDTMRSTNPKKNSMVTYDLVKAHETIELFNNKYETRIKGSQNLEKFQQQLDEFEKNANENPNCGYYQNHASLEKTLEQHVNQLKEKGIIESNDHEKEKVIDKYDLFDVNQEKIKLEMAEKLTLIQQKQSQNNVVIGTEHN